MAQYSELPVYRATYDLLLTIFQFMKVFNKEYKYTVGKSLKKETIGLLYSYTAPITSRGRFYKRNGPMEEKK